MRRRRDTLRVDLVRALDGSIDVPAALVKRDLAAAPRVPAPPPIIEIVDNASAHATVLQIRAHDMPGLLYRISFGDLDLRRNGDQGVGRHPRARRWSTCST